jgi:hypothetical protein
VLFVLRDLLAKAGKRAGLCEIVIEELRVRKRRWPWGNAMAFAQNQTLALLSEPVRLVSGIAWHEREQLAWQGRARLDDGWLIVPRVPGPTLGVALERASASQAIVALSACLRALRALHHRGLTHGDATCDNVCVEGDDAAFFDFEQIHVGPDLPRAGVRDDLVALLCSALTIVPSEHTDCVIEATLDASERTLLADYARRYPKTPPYLQQARMNGRSVAYRHLTSVLLRAAN